MRRSLPVALTLVFVSLLLSACAQTELVTHLVKKAMWVGEEEKTKGTYKIGNPYKVENVWYYPEENFNLVETGIASWYGPGFHAELTANGEIFDQEEMTAAHRTLQLPSIVKVTNLENGRSVVVRVNDRGPFKRGRVLDVSRRAAKLLGFLDKGTARVRLQVLEKESRIIAKAAQSGEDTTKMTLADIHKRAGSTRFTPIGIRKEGRKTVGYEPPPTPVDEATPESLRTPTITVEALTTSSNPLSSISYETPKGRVLTRGKIKDGRFVPDKKVVSREPVQATGLFVQAGSFGVKSNAERLAKNLERLGKTWIEPVKTSKGTLLHRVKVGPINTLEEADAILAEVVDFGLPSAMVVKHKNKKRIQ